MGTETKYRRMGGVELAQILSEADSTVPHYVPHLVQEIRHLRQQLMRARNRIESSRCYLHQPLVDAVAIINAALDVEAER